MLEALTKYNDMDDLSCRHEKYKILTKDKFSEIYYCINFESL